MCIVAVGDPEPEQHLGTGKSPAGWAVIRSIAPSSANAAAWSSAPASNSASTSSGSVAPSNSASASSRLPPRTSSAAIRCPTSTCTTRSRTVQPSHGVGRSQSPGPTSRRRRPNSWRARVERGELIHARTLRVDVSELVERDATFVTRHAGVDGCRGGELLGDARERVAVLVLHLLAEAGDVDVHGLLVRPRVLAHGDRDLEAPRARVLADVRVLEHAVAGGSELRARA